MGSKSRIVVPAGEVKGRGRGRERGGGMITATSMIDIRHTHPYYDVVCLQNTCISISTFIGRVGLAWDNGDALILEPGRVYNWDSQRFSYVGSVPVNEALIVHGSIKIVTVKEG